MAVNKATRLSKIAREFNVGISTIIDFLNKKGHNVDSNPNTKISPELYDILVKEYSSDINAKKESEKITLKKIRDKKEAVTIQDLSEEEIDEDNTEVEEEDDAVLVKDLSSGKKPSEEQPKKEEASKIKVVGKIDIDALSGKKKAEKEEAEKEEKKAKEKAEAEKLEARKKAEDEEKAEKAKAAKEEEEQQQQQQEELQAEETKEEPVKAEETPEEIPEKEVSEEGETIAAEDTEADIEEEEGEGEEDKFVETQFEKLNAPTVIGKIDLDSMNQRTRPRRKTKEEREEERRTKKESRKASHEEAREQAETGEQAEPRQSRDTEDMVRSKIQKLNGPTIVGKIDLPKQGDKKKPVASSSDPVERDKKKKRKRIRKDKPDAQPSKPEQRDSRGGDKKRRKRTFKPEVSDEDVQKQIKDTLARLTSKGKSKGSKHRREKREAARHELEQEQLRQEEEKNVLKVTEFVSVSELASMMNVPPTDVISTCMNLGLFVSINQRLDAETMSLVADEFNYKVEFVSVDFQEAIGEEEDNVEDLQPRPPIVTVMGHVDHGKTKLLDYIRRANVIAGEAGGITQHIGAYGVELENGKQITFLDTPGHEAFTAMRARGAQITDVAIIVVAADDGVKPQTVEAINHASAAGVPIVFAINKIDKPTANADKVKEELANMNYLVEDWGGKYQSQEISAKNGINIEDLLEKVLLEAELLDLKANPDKKAIGTVIESSLDKGRGYTATILVESGTLYVGDIILAGHYYGHVKAMFNERGKTIEYAGPSTPVVILGLNGAPQAGDKFHIFDTDKEAKEIATKREQLQREQGLRTQKHITLDEIGRRIAIGNFQELNIIVKGDVDGSVEALADSLIKLSTEEIEVNIRHKAVGQISESDILLAAASDAIIIGFQVRPSLNARKLAEKEEIDIRLYSIIYDAIEDVKAAMEGMLSPEIKEEIIGSVEVLETFKITKVGTIAGGLVREGKINRNNKVRVIRDGIVVYTGELGSLKRFKDDAREVTAGLECGLNVANFNDIKVGDIIEAFTETEVAKKLK